MFFSRYRHPTADAIWNTQRKYALWADIEKACLQPHLSSPAERENALSAPVPDPQRVADAEVRVGHEMGAFLHVFSKGLPVPARHWLHHGLTSSDVQDTADQARCVITTEAVWEAANVLYASLKERDDLNTPTQGYTHGQPASTTTLGNRLLAHAGPLAEQPTLTGYGMLSGAVGTRPVIDRDQERFVLNWLYARGWPRLRTLEYTTQVIPRQHFTAHARYWLDILEVCEQLAMDMRTMTATRDLDIAARQIGSSAMPHKVNPAGAEQICGLARLGRGLMGAMGEGKALWQDRDLTHSSVDRVALPTLAHLTLYALDRTREMWAKARVVERHPDWFIGQSEALMVAAVELAPEGWTREDLYGLVSEMTRHEAAPEACVNLARALDLPPKQLWNRFNQIRMLR